MPDHWALYLVKDFDFILREMGSHADVLMGGGLSRCFLNRTAALKRDGRTGVDGNSGTFCSTSP